MPALANSTQKPKRASFARVLARLTMALGIGSGAAMHIAPVNGQACDRCAHARASRPSSAEGLLDGQSCDRCAGAISPSCGCEFSSRNVPRTKKCNCRSVRMLSLGEKFLSHLDKVGDRVEAKMQKPCISQCDHAQNSFAYRAPTCGCESSNGPSCGCEFNSAQQFQASTPSQQVLPQRAAASPIPERTNQHAIGSIGDNHLSRPSVPDATTSPIPTAPQQTRKRLPFEQRNPTFEHNRIPAIESPLPNAKSSVPANLPPPVTNKSTPPQKPHPTAPIEKKFPDVLVDPFKDDASFRGTRQKMEGILLTSDRHALTDSEPTTTANHSRDDVPVPPTIESPTRLTPAQMSVPSSQLEAGESASNEPPAVVTSNYLDSSPVKVVVRKESSKNTFDALPRVSKVRVPQKR